MNGRQARRTLGVTLLALGVTLPGGAGAATLRIGVIGPYTGGSAAFGISMREGVQLATDELNAGGGIKGRGRIELALADDEGKPDVSVNAMTRLLERDKVVAVIGPINSSNCLASMKVTQKAEIPQVTPVCASPAITAHGNPFIFRTTLSDRRYAGQLAEFALKTAGLKRFAILHDADDYGTDGANVFEQRLRDLGTPPVARERWNRGDKSFSAQLAKVKETGADAMLTWGLHTEIALLAKQARQLGITARILGGTGLATPKFIELGGDAVEGSLVTLLFVPDHPDPKVQDFVKRYQAKFNRRPDTFAAQAYDSLHLLAGAIERAASTTGRAIRDALLKAEQAGITGPIVFDETGDRVRGLLVTVIKGGKFVPYGM